MPKLIDNKGQLHHSYYSMIQANKRYAREEKEVIAEPSEVVDEPITISDAGQERGREKESSGGVEHQTYYCLNCGEGVSKGDKTCQTCGAELAWEGIE